MKIKKFKSNAIIPTYGSDGAAAFDFYAAIEEAITLKPGERRLIPTGVGFDIPSGYALWVTPRSGLALKNGITIANTPGLVDEDYKGEVQVIILNAGAEEFEIVPDMRIAQGTLIKVLEHQIFEEVEELEASARGARGFGSTGR